MANHPNRGASRLNPRPQDLEEFRARHRLSEREAAALIFESELRWQAYEVGTARMHAGLWELARAKMGELALS